MTDPREPDQNLNARALAACASLALLLVSTFILNRELFPRVAEVFPLARELSTYGGAVIAVCIAAAAYRKPAILHARSFSAACLAVLAAGTVALAAGLAGNDPLPIALGSPLGGLCAWFFVLEGMALTKSGLKASMVAIPTAFMASYCVEGLFALAIPDLPDAAAAAAYFVCVAASYILIRLAVCELLGDLRRVPAAADLDITHPVSFLPLSSFVFVSIAVFNTASGFSLASPYAAAANPLLASAAACVPMGALFLVTAVLRRPLSPDALHTASFLLVFGALSAMPAVMLGAGPAAQDASAALMSAGTDCFTMLMYVLISAVGARNPLGALATSAIAIAAQWLGIGCGALLIQFARWAAADAGALACAATAAAFVFVAYNTCLGKHRSFAKAVEAIRPVEPATVSCAPSKETGKPYEESAEESADSRFDDRCAAVAEQFGLTGRETDVLMLLARGRTAPIIQEKLVLSHNTVKTHVRHIYTKMDVHSQQELIDIVERG